MLRSRNCCLDLESHRYFWDPDGARIPMRVSVTGVINHGKDPDRFKVSRAPPIAAPTSIGAWRPWPKARQCPMPCISPEGIDCSDWFDQLHHGEINKGLTMSDFGKKPRSSPRSSPWWVRKVTRRSAGPAGQVPGRPGWWISRPNQPVTAAAPKEDRASYAAQAGGYLWLMDCGDGAKDERPPYVEKCRTLIVTPKARSSGSPPWTHTTAPKPGKKPGASIRPLPWLFDPRPSRTQDTPPNTNPTP